MLTVEFHEHGICLPDCNVEKFITTVLDRNEKAGNDTKVIVSQKLIVDAFKKVIIEGKINKNEICFI